MILSLFLAFTSFSAETFSARAESGLFVVVGDRVYSYAAPELKSDVFGCYLSGESAEIDGICQENYVAAKDAQIYFDPNAKILFTYEKEREGIRVDQEKLREDIDAALSVGGGTVTASFIKIEPSVKVAELKKQTFERGRFTTYFDSSTKERIHNVSLAAKTISGKRIKKGETFSFNEVVGERSEARGYKTAKIIKDGRFEDGLGGGVCQVSTTLYNAALLSGLTIVESHPHTLAVSYVENSFDAMVSYGYADLKIKNDTGGNVFIAAYVDDRSLTFVIFGEDLNKKIERKSVVTEVLKPKEIVRETDELSEGETRLVVKARNGYKSSGYLIVTENGKSSKKLIRKDSYDAVDGIIETGRKKADNAADQ